MRYQGIEIEKICHAGFKLKAKGLVVFIDPFRVPAEHIEPADIVFITHEHFDHCSPEDLEKISSSEATIVATPACEPGVSRIAKKSVVSVAPGDRFEVKGIGVQVVPAYNTNKFRSPGVLCHPKADGKVGYILTINGVSVYHAGDTDCIEEMKDLGNIDVALVPVSGAYVMTAEEAAEAVKIIKPKLAVPMHYGAIVGSLADAEKFKKLAPCPVEIL